MADSYLSDVENLDSTEGYAEPDEAASDELADGVDLLEELNGPSLRERVLEWTQQRPRATLGIVFGIGLIIGWFLIGWVIFPPQWHKTAPWDMSEERQRLYLRLVAEEYWHTDDAKVVYDALDGWDQDELGILLTDMLRDNELTADNRQHVLGLAQALDLATYEQPLLASLLFNNTAHSGNSSAVIGSDAPCADDHCGAGCQAVR